MRYSMKRIVTAAEKDRLDTVMDTIESWLAEADCPMKTMLQIRLAAEETFVNIASYAYPEGGGEVVVEGRGREGGNGIVLRFIDEGTAFDPLAKEDADTSREALMGREGGLGILLVKKTMDRVEYARENGRNILTIEKTW